MDLKPDDIESVKYQLATLVESNNPVTFVAKNNNNIVGFINGHIISFPLLLGK